MTRDSQRPILLLQKLDLILRQLHIEGSQEILQVRKARGADDRRSDARLRHNPSQGDLRHADALALRKLFDSGKNRSESMTFEVQVACAVRTAV